LPVIESTRDALDEDNPWLPAFERFGASLSRTISRFEPKSEQELLQEAVEAAEAKS
jgi:hypothetical protein